MLKNIFKYLREFRDAKVFFVNLSIIVSVAVIAIFSGIYFMADSRLVTEHKLQAASYIDLITRVRLWNAMHEGVYVRKTDTVESNPYLKEVGIVPDIACSGNQVFTLRNPSLMTREISEQTTSATNITFHMMSLRPLNPANAPDAFERRALEQFERKTSEVWDLDESGPAPRFRYVVPLVTVESCLPCHGKSGYKNGDIRGGISVTIPIPGEIAARRSTLLSLGMLCFLTLGIMLGLIYFIGWRLVVRLQSTQSRLTHLATMDELTGLMNRRVIMGRLDEEFSRARRTGAELGIIMIDIDHFKTVNDTHGHPFGDQVLKQIAARLSNVLRQYDMLGRIGGEEFLIICPATTEHDLNTLAERLRLAVKTGPIGVEQINVSLTISIGITPLRPEDPGPDILLRRSDRALYRAKRKGRDQVVCL